MLAMGEKRLEMNQNVSEHIESSGNVNSKQVEAAQLVIDSQLGCQS